MEHTAFSNQTAVYFEDYQIGQSLSSYARTVTEADIVMHAGLGDFSPRHMDAEFAKATAFGRRIAHGTLIFSMAMGMNATAINPVSFSYGYDHLRFVEPVFIGDTIRATIRVKEKRDHPRHSDKGVLVELVEVTNQRGETAMICEHLSLVARRQVR